MQNNDLHTNTREEFIRLAQRMAERDKTALEEFYIIYGKMIYSFARAVCHVREDADEIVNDVLVKVWNSSIDLCRIKEPIAWLYTITSNIAKNRLKKRKSLPIPENVFVLESGYRAVEDNDVFYRLIADLQEKERQVMIYKFVADMTFNEIAEIINKPLSSVTSLYYRALDKIKSKVKK